jgi:hypothetical protein
MDSYNRTNSAPAGPSSATLTLEPYERTYSACAPLDIPWISGESTLNDSAIAAALQEERGPPPEDTSMDHALAVALYNEQVDKLCEQQQHMEQQHSTPGACSVTDMQQPGCRRTRARDMGGWRRIHQFAGPSQELEHSTGGVGTSRQRRQQPSGPWQLIRQLRSMHRPSMRSTEVHALH